MWGTDLRVPVQQTESDDAVSSPTITLVIIGNVRLYRDGLAAALAQYADIDVAGSFECDASAVDHVAALKARLVLVDVAARGSLELMRELRQRVHATRIVAFAVEEQQASLLAFAEAGVS